MEDSISRSLCQRIKVTLLIEKTLTNNTNIVPGIILKSITGNYSSCGLSIINVPLMVASTVEPRLSGSPLSELFIIRTRTLLYPNVLLPEAWCEISHKTRAEARSSLYGLSLARLHVILARSK